MAAMAQMQNALRAEIRDLKVKIVSLETAEADNARLRKELSSIKTTCENNLAKQELDFLNRMAEISRENSARIADLEAKLAEKRQLTSGHGPKSVHDNIEGMEQIAGQNRDEVDILKKQLRVVQTKRDELTRKLEEATVELALKDCKLESLGVDDSFVRCNPASDRSFSMEHSSLQRMLREANEEIGRLKAGTTEHPSIGGQVDVQLQRRVERLERENLKLHDALKQGEQSKKKHDITVLQLERRNHDLKMSLQKMEIQGQSGTVETRASYGFTDDGNLEIECQRLQSELRKTKNALNLANLKQEELSYELKKASTASSVECTPEVGMHQQRNQSLQVACEKLEGEVDELKGQLGKSGELKSSLLAEINEAKTLLQSSERDKKKLSEQLAQAENEMRQPRDSGVGSSQDRTSDMIRQMEQNLKREKVNTDNITAKYRQQAVADKQTTEVDSSYEILTKMREDNRKLNLDVNQLQRKLDDERKLSRCLRSEIGDMRASYSTESKPSVRDRASFSSVPSTSKSQTLNRTTKQTSNSSTRRSVKGIAARFENGGFPTQPEEKATSRPSFSKEPTEQPVPHTSFSNKTKELTDEVRGLRRELETQTKQGIELEEELTRQCEINSSLLKEINELSLEIEAKRKESANIFKDQEELVEFRSQITKLSQDLTIASKDKAELQSKYETNQKRLASLQEQVSEKVKDYDKNHSRDEQIIHQLQSKVKSLEADLANTLTLVEDLRDKLNSQAESNPNGQNTDLQSMKRALHEKEDEITQMTREKEQIVLSMNDMTGFRKEEIQELQLELTRMKSKNSEQVREMESLREKLEQRNYNIQRIASNDDNAAGNLQSENTELRQKLVEATSERLASEAKLKQYLSDRGGSSKSVQILRERNAALKFEVEKLTKKLSKLSGGDKMQVTRVMI
ncbi:unnamed protein product [Cylindrotheca closterium]|uniref:Uncharacterized protein n=1 Tax=Cylindrotheca closterium TaxID=2856 RepID=A0AAD2CJR5_9STRA|nr:unnamed protein product [Cylindrotheca closterium]